MRGEEIKCMSHRGPHSDVSGFQPSHATPPLPHPSAQPHTRAWLHLHPMTCPYHPTCPHQQDRSNFHLIVTSSNECAMSVMGQACHISFPEYVCWALIFGFCCRGRWGLRGAGGGRWLLGSAKSRQLGLKPLGSVGHAGAGPG